MSRLLVCYRSKPDIVVIKFIKHGKNLDQILNIAGLYPETMFDSIMGWHLEFKYQRCKVLS